MLFRASHHFYGERSCFDKIFMCMCQCSSELHIISTLLATIIDCICDCVNALPSFTSFLPHPVRNPWFTRLFEACFAGIFQNILTNSLFRGVFMSWRFFSYISSFLGIFSFSTWILFFIPVCSFSLFHHYNFFPGQRQAEIPKPDKHWTWLERTFRLPWVTSWFRSGYKSKSPISVSLFSESLCDTL